MSAATLSMLSLLPIITVGDVSRRSSLASESGHALGVRRRDRTGADRVAA